MTRSYGLDHEASQQNRLDVEATQAKVIVEVDDARRLGSRNPARPTAAVIVRPVPARG